MEPETVLNLFDSLWFYLNILEKQSKTTSIPSNPAPQTVQISSQLTIKTRSKSLDAADLSFSPNSVLDKPQHLQTILSDREFYPEMAEMKKPSRALNVKKKKRLSKSLSELEFEELKGFTDLGFVFSEEDKLDSSLVEIVPGLQKLGQMKKKMDDCNLSDHDEGKIEEHRARPYLSEAWERENELLMRWRVVPVMVGNEIDMKDSLKWWAHSVVASAVR